MRHSAIKLLLFAAILLVTTQGFAAAPDGDVDRILALDKAPPGVVFEVVTGDSDALNAVIPRVSGYAERLRARFPDLPVAVMTHGSEQFSLLASEQDSYGDLHAQVRALSVEGDVDVHVCGNHASWRNNTAEDFPDYVDVASAASAKMREYRAMGYIVVLF